MKAKKREAEPSTFDQWVKREIESFYDLPIANRLTNLEIILIPYLPKSEKAKIGKIIRAAIKDVDEWRTRQTTPPEVSTPAVKDGQVRASTIDLSAHFTSRIDHHIRQNLKTAFQLLVHQLMFEMLLSGAPISKGWIAPNLREVLNLRDGEDLIDTVQGVFLGPLKKRLGSRYPGGQIPAMRQPPKRVELIIYAARVDSLNTAIAEAKAFLSNLGIRNDDARKGAAKDKILWPEWLNHKYIDRLVNDIDSSDLEPAKLARKYAVKGLSFDKYGDTKLKLFLAQGREFARQPAAPAGLLLGGLIPGSDEVW